MDKNIGKPLGDPNNYGKGEARPEKAGAEGGSGFLGDQRQERPDSDPGRVAGEEPLLDGTISQEDIQGDIDTKQPGAS